MVDRQPLEEEKKEIISEMSGVDSADSSKVNSPAGSVVGIGAFSLCNTIPLQNLNAEKELQKRRKLMKRLRETELRNSMPSLEKAKSSQKKERRSKSTPRNLIHFGKGLQEPSKFRIPRTGQEENVQKKRSKIKRATLASSEFY